MISKLRLACFTQVHDRSELSRHGHVAVAVRPGGLSHLELELLVWITLLGVGTRTASTVDEGLAGAVGDRGLGGILTAQAGLCRFGGGLDVLVGDRLGDDVFKELEVVLV